MSQIQPEQLVRVAQRVRPALEQLLEIPGMRTSLGSVGVRYMGELVPNQPKIVLRIERHMREISAAKHEFRERHEFFPDRWFREGLKRDLEAAQGSFKDRDWLDRLRGQQDDVDNIEVTEQKAQLLAQAIGTINEAWRDAVIKTAFEFRGDPQTAIEQWGVSAQLAANAARAMSLSGIGGLGATPGPPMTRSL